MEKLTHLHSEEGNLTERLTVTECKFVCPMHSETNKAKCQSVEQGKVYCGAKQYGLRAQAGNFDEAQLEEAVQLAHARGVRVNLTLNIFAQDGDLNGMVCAAQHAREIGVDALIVSDLGAIAKIHREVPGIDIHVSTQASTTNSESARVYRDLGATRVVLARELSMDAIEQMACELSSLTHREAATFGEAHYKRTGAGGVREEAAAGFPSVRHAGLPRFCAALCAGLSLNDAGLCALIALMACAADTNAVRRGGEEGARRMQEAAAALDQEIAAALEQGAIHAFDLPGRMRAWDAELTRKNISPGGCADMLALTLLAAFMDGKA